MHFRFRKRRTNTLSPIVEQKPALAGDPGGVTEGRRPTAKQPGPLRAKAGKIRLIGGEYELRSVHKKTS